MNLLLKLFFYLPELQKKLLFVTKLFRWLQKAVGKTSFFDGKSLSSIITNQILKHLWRKNKSAENAYYFGGKYSCLTFCDKIKIFVANKVLFTTIKEKPSELLTLSICDKHSSIVKIKDNISDRHKAIENGKIFWRENSPLSFHICDDIYPSQLLFLIFLIEFVFATNMLTVVNS